MSNVVIKPLGMYPSPDGTYCVTIVDRVAVHGQKPMTPEGKAAMEQLVRHVQRRFIEETEAECRRALSGPPKLETPDCGCRGIFHTCAMT